MKKPGTYFSKHAVFLGVALAALLVSGCKVIPDATVDPTRYYVLNSPAAVDPVVASPVGKYQIGLRPVELPGYLHNQKSIVVRLGVNEVRFQHFSCWAEPLDAGVNRVLKDRLRTTDAISGVSTYPFSVDVRRDYDVVVRVLNCEGLVRGGASVVRFAAAYDIIASGAGNQVVVRRTFNAPDQPWDGVSFGALAQLLSDAVAKLSDDIAANLPK